MTGRRRESGALMELERQVRQHTDRVLVALAMVGRTVVTCLK